MTIDYWQTAEYNTTRCICSNGPRPPLRSKKILTTLTSLKAWAIYMQVTVTRSSSVLSSSFRAIFRLGPPHRFVPPYTPYPQWQISGMLLASHQTIHFAINWSISWLHVKQQHSRQQQIPRNLAKQILMVTLNKSEFQRLVVSYYTIIPRTHRSRKTIIGGEDYQLTIIWARRLSGDNYLSGGLSLEIPRGISQLWLFFPSSYFWTIENCNSPAANNVSIQHQNYLWNGQKFALVGFHWVQYQLSIPGAKGLCSWWNIDNPTPNPLNSNHARKLIIGQGTNPTFYPRRCSSSQAV